MGNTSDFKQINKVDLLVLLLILFCKFGTPFWFLKQMFTLCFM